MNIGKIGLIGALAAILALPAIAQTTQTNPTKSTPSAAAPTSSTTARPAPATSSALVDINSTSEEDLDKLPGIGKVRATAIIKGRPYNGKDDLLNRHILQPNVYDGIKGQIVAKKR
jgi:competence protein ComEA